MSNYTPSTDFSAKDALLSGNPAKVIRGIEISAEFASVQTAVNSKYDAATVVPITAGGTGSTTAALALAALGERTGATGTLSVPSGTTAQRSTTLGIGVRYNADLASFEGYNGVLWGSIGGGATGAGGDTVFQTNKTVMTTSYALPTGSNASTVGPLTINSGVILTIPSGQRMVVL